MKVSGAVALGGFAAVLAVVTGTLLLLAPAAREPSSAQRLPTPTRARLDAPVLQATPRPSLAPAEAVAVPLLPPGAPVSRHLVAGLAPEQLLSGSVRDTRGEPVVGAWVAWRPERFQAPAEHWPLYARPCEHGTPVPAPALALRVTQTDAAGHFSLPRKPGFLRVQHPDQLAAVLPVHAASPTIDVTLADGVVLAGSVSGLPTGSTLVVRGTSWNESGPLRAVIEHREPLPEQGSYRLTGLPRGRVDLRVLGPDGLPLTSRRLKLLRDEANRFDVDLRGARPIQLTLTGPAAERAQELCLQAVDGGLAAAPLTALDGNHWRGAVAWTGRTLLLGRLADQFTRDTVLADLQLSPDRGTYEVSLGGSMLVVHIALQRQPDPLRLTLRSLDLDLVTSQTLAPGTLTAEFSDLPPGRYLVSCRDGARVTHHGAARLTHHQDRAQVVLADRLLTQRVLVLDPAGRPRQGARVDVRLAGHAIAWGSSDAEGLLTLKFSPPGPFPLTLVPFRRELPRPGARHGTTLFPQEPVLLRVGQRAADLVTLVVSGD